MWLLPLHGRKRLNGGRLSLTVVGRSSVYSAEACDLTIGQRTAQTAATAATTLEKVHESQVAPNPRHTRRPSYLHRKIVTLSAHLEPMHSPLFETVGLLTERGIALVRKCQPTSGP